MKFVVDVSLWQTNERSLMFDDFDPLNQTSTEMTSSTMTSEPHQQQQQQQFDEQFADLLGGFESNVTADANDVASSKFIGDTDIVECEDEDCQVATETNFEEVRS